MSRKILVNATSKPIIILLSYSNYNSYTSDPIKTSSGVRQGCLLSPLLVLLVPDGVLRRVLDGRNRGITWRLRETLEGVQYADDVCIVCHKHEHMQRNDIVYLLSPSHKHNKYVHYCTGWRKRNACFSNNCNFVYFQYKKVMLTPKQPVINAV
jgi:hypothetical protein